MRVIRFFPYFGAKHSRWRKYPAPKYGTIIEPFAGSAAYSTHYAGLNVILCDLDERIAAVWDWLISVPEEEFLRLPTFEGVERVSELGITEPGPLHFLRLWAGNAALGQDAISSISRQRDARQPNSSWCPAGRERISRQLRLIRHWKVYHGSYQDVDASEIGNREATWFIDPPYQEAGKHYRHGCKGLDYADLAQWCRARRGQAIVCENEGADWLPFRLLGGDGNLRKSTGKDMGRGRKEAVWLGAL